MPDPRERLISRLTRGFIGFGPPRVDGYTGEAVGRAGQAAARFATLPYWQQGDRRRFCHPDFGANLVGELWRRGTLPPKPVAKFFGRLTCARCGRDLETEPRPVSFRLKLALPQLEPIELTVEVPAVRCTNCGLEHWTDDPDRVVESDLSDAMIAAFESVGVRP